MSAAGILLLLGATNAIRAEPPAGNDADAPKTLPQEQFFSALKQSLRMGFDHEVVRGHFDLGTAPNAHRYYCLVDTKTGGKEPNGVLGQPVALPDGSTGLKIDSVSLFGCDNAEKQGMLVTAGYVLHVPGRAALAPSAPPQPPAQSQPPPPVPTQPPVQAGAPEVTPDKVDVAGVKLGMSLDEVRVLLKSKGLHEYTEATEALSFLDSAKGATQPLPNGRFVNAIAAWTAPSAGDSLEAAGESYEVMFTPVPGGERAMAIVHTVGYSSGGAVREIALENGLLQKYGGFAGSNNLPESPTWRLQKGGDVQVGDPCNRRGLFGGRGALRFAGTARENIALKKTLDEFQYQIDHCGIAIVTEDHVTANGGALREDRLVTRFTVTAYSPSIALEGAKTATQLIQTARGAVNQAAAPRAKDQPAPNL